MYQTYHFMSKCKRSERVLKNILLKESVRDKVTISNPELIVKENEHLQDKDVDADHKVDNNIADGNNHYTEDFLDNDDDNCSDVDDPAEIKSETSNIEDQTDDISPDTDILSKIQSIKNQISKIRVKNKVRLRQMAKAQLVDYNELPKSNKRPYIFRKG